MYISVWWSSTMEVDAGSCPLKKETINTAYSCALVTALGTQQHTCSPVLCCCSLPEVQMSSFTVITFLPPLTIDYPHFSFWSPAVEMACMACFPYPRTGRAEVPTSCFYTKKGRRGFRLGHGAAWTDYTVTYLPISSMPERTTEG